MSENHLLQQLIELSRELGREDRRLAILGEGNTSADAGDGTFWVKASGSHLGTASEDSFCRVDRTKVLAFLDGDDTSEQAVLDALRGSVVGGASKVPSVETFLHALCQEIGKVGWVGHTHTDSVLGVLASSSRAEAFRRHLFPDAIVVCGRHVGVVPYVDPGIRLAKAMREVLRSFIATYSEPPKVILMENHGPVILGKTSRDVLNTSLMLDKWARVLLHTLAAGGPRFLPDSEADRIDRRLDEQVRRQEILKQTP